MAVLPPSERAPGAVREYLRVRPAPQLRPLIAFYSGYRECGVAPGQHVGLPSPYLTLILTLDEPLTVRAHPDPRQPGGRYETLIGGLHTGPALIEHQGSQAGIQVALSPLGALPLLGLPAGEIAGLDLPAEVVWGDFAYQLREQLCAVAGWAQRFAILDRLLITRLHQVTGTGTAVQRRPLAPEVTRAWQHLLTRAGDVSVADLAAETGWSARYLQQRFRAATGLTPKAAARVIRFDRARRVLMASAVAGRTVGLADLAAGAGYYDQAHLARDFRHLAGRPPSSWLAAELRNVQAAAPWAGQD
jgi:AraC-like DNA-binding protein